MSDKPTGVFVRLPLSEDEALLYLRESQRAWDEGKDSSGAIACESGLLAIGTPVTGGVLYPVGYTSEDAIGGLATGIYSSASIFREKDVEHYDIVSLIRKSDAQAHIAALESEVVRLQEALDRIRLVPFPMLDLPAAIMHGIAHKDLKGGAA